MQLNATQSNAISLNLQAITNGATIAWERRHQRRGDANDNDGRSEDWNAQVNTGQEKKWSGPKKLATRQGFDKKSA